MAGVGPAQALLAREIRDASGGDEIVAGAGALDQGGVGPTQQAAGIIGERCGRGERRPYERRTPPRLQAVADHVADDQHGGILRSRSRQVKVAADLFGGGGQEGRGELQSGAPGQLGRRERIPDRAQVLQLMFGRLEALTQHREIPRMHCGFFAQSSDQRLLALLSVTHVVDIAPLRGDLGAQPPKLSLVFTGVFAHPVLGTLARTISRASRIVSHRRPGCPCRGQLLKVNPAACTSPPSSSLPSSERRRHTPQRRRPRHAPGELLSPGRSRRPSLRLPLGIDGKHARRPSGAVDGYCHPRTCAATATPAAPDMAGA
jgi:hypothetical protein